MPYRESKRQRGGKRTFIRHSLPSSEESEWRNMTWWEVKVTLTSHDRPLRARLRRMFEEPIKEEANEIVWTINECDLAQQLIAYLWNQDVVHEVKFNKVKID